MRKLNWRTFSRIIWPDYAMSKSAQTLHRRWLQKQAFVLCLALSALTLVAFPLYHVLTVRHGETVLVGQPQRIAVLVIAAFCLALPLFFVRLRNKAQFFSFVNLIALFACFAIDIAMSATQRRYTTIGLLPLFGSAFVFTNIRLMTFAYAVSAGFFVWLATTSHRQLEIIIIYLAAYTIAWWMAMIRLRSLYRISFDQARLYERKAYDDRVRLARDLHDSLGGDLMQLALQLSGETPRAQMLELAQSVIARTRTLVTALEPNSDIAPFPSYAKGYAARMTQTGKLQVYCDERGAWPPLRLDDNINLQAIFSEWMTNTLKYSLATRIDISLIQRAEFCYLVVRDNGQGFRWKGESRGSGLRNIFLRAQLIGARAFSRNTGSGTQFFVKFRSRQ